MKVLCPSCEQLSELSEFRQAEDGSGLWVRCVLCEVETWVLASRGGSAKEVVRVASVFPGSSSEGARVLALIRPAVNLKAGEDPFEVPPGFCSKCLAPRSHAGLSCPQCGLVFENFQPGEVGFSAGLRAAFLTLVTEGYADPEKHQEVAKLALRSDELAQLGRLYRIRLARDSGDLAAQRGRDEVLRLSMERARWSRTERHEPPRELRQVAAVIMVLVGALALAFIAFRMMHGH